MMRANGNGLLSLGVRPKKQKTHCWKQWVFLDSEPCTGMAIALESDFSALCGSRARRCHSRLTNALEQSIPRRWRYASIRKVMDDFLTLRFPRFAPSVP